jgi:N-acetylmuramoyl-L-alanine amidase
LSIITSYPVYYKVNKLDKSGARDPERRIYVDLYGVDLAASPAAIPSNEPGIAYIRTGRVGDGNVRVVVDLRRRLAFRVNSPVDTDQVHVAMEGLGEGSNPVRVATRPNRPIVRHPEPQPQPEPQPARRPVVEPLPVRPPDPVTPASTEDAHAQTTSTGLRITNVSCRVVSPEVTEVSVKASSAAKYRWITLDAPYRLAFDLAGAGLDPGLPVTQPVGSEVVKGIRAGVINPGKQEFGRVVIDLSQAVDFSVTTQQADDGTIYTISLQRPSPVSVASASDALKGKVIMVDPGHGADDTGALDRVTGYREKDFNLAIAKKVRDALARNGATVYMTREDDIKPSLAARPKMAIAVGADFFVSVHCDESGAQNAHSGTTVYYHAQNATCRRLALDIVHRVAAESGLPANGVKSDTIRFRTGFAVLRGSPMPAVLVECGYMNNSADVAKLRTDEVQQHIADGVAQGLIDFIRSGE